MVQKTVFFAQIFAAILTGAVFIDQTIGFPEGMKTPSNAANAAILASTGARLSNNGFVHPMLRPTETGSYLAGRSAQKRNDWDQASFYMSRALHLSGSGLIEYTGLLDRAFLLAILDGDIDKALALTDDITARKDNGELAYILAAVDDFKSGDAAKASSILAKIDTNVFGGFAVPLLKVWTEIDAHPQKAAGHLAASRFAKDPAYGIHRALMYDFMGETDKADAAYRAALGTGLGLQETLFAANFFERNDDPETASKIYDLLHKKDAENDFIAAALTRIKNHQKPAPMIASAKEGLSYALFSMAQLLAERDALDSALIYGRIIEHLGTDNDYVRMLLGDLMAENNHFSAALEYYKGIKPESVLFKTAQLKRVGILEIADQTDKALELLATLRQNRNFDTEAWIQTGDIYQRQNRLDLALNAYDTAIKSLGDRFDESHWGLIYARGITYERMNNWKAAEKDLIKALEYSPNNPAVLNYLGYSWIEKGVNLTQALDMLKRAVALRPNDGYIIDSYGWAFYKLGKYKDAVSWLEKAVEYHPEDSTLNAHLGDAYWQIGRLKEARFQWERARLFSSDAVLKEELSRKLEHGIDTPIAVAAENQEAHLVR